MHYLCIMFKRIVDKYITEKSLFNTNDKILIALSGGADSVALLRVLLSLGYHCICAHCNFHLRGEESNQDESFVQKLCESLAVPLHINHFNTQEYADKHHLSIEMAARELRYEWFEQLRKETGASVIAVAHHQDDSVETFLLNLIRGTGINGLKGISPQNGYVVRPLLQVNRESIIDYLKHINQDYVVDSTNLEDEYTRNKIRLNILPLMKEINPSVSDSIIHTSEHLAEAAEVYHKERNETINRIINKKDGVIEIPIDALLDETSPQSLLFEILYPYGFNSAQIKDIYRSLYTQSGKHFITESYRLLRDRNHLIIEAICKDEMEQAPILTYETHEITPDFVIPKDKRVACLDADKVCVPLIIRKCQKGDKFSPLGMTGKKNISDYMTDHKFTLFQKEKQYVACQNDQIVWLIGERIDHHFRLTTTSKRALIIRYSL